MSKSLPVAVLLTTLSAVIGSIVVDEPMVIVFLGAPALFTVLSSARGRRTLASRVLVSAPLVGAAVLLRFSQRTSLSEVLLPVLRVVSAVAWSSLLSSALTPREIAAALRALGVPVAFVELLAHTRRFAVQLAASASDAWTAATLRAGLASLRATAGTGGQVAGVLVVRAFDRAESVAIADALRGRHLGEDTAHHASGSQRGPSP